MIFFGIFCRQTAKQAHIPSWRNVCFASSKYLHSICRNLHNVSISVTLFLWWMVDLRFLFNYFKPNSSFIVYSHCNSLRNSASNININPSIPKCIKMACFLTAEYKLYSDYWGSCAQTQRGLPETSFLNTKIPTRSQFESRRRTCLGCHRWYSLSGLNIGTKQQKFIVRMYSVWKLMQRFAQVLIRSWYGDLQDQERL